MNTDFLDKWTSLSSIITPVQELVDAQSLEQEVRIFVKRDDLLDPYVMGNKWRKLKYNLWAAYQQGYDTLLTFGGAHSNHILATAAAGHYLGFKTVGVVRGEELCHTSNDTLSQAHQLGMKLHFVSRTQYRQREDPGYWKELASLFGKVYVLPEGGNNALAGQGTREIIGELPCLYDYYCCSCGTGSTAAGLAASLPSSSQLLVLPALSQIATQKEMVAQHNVCASATFQMDYVFGGYAKYDETLASFMNDFPLPLDPVYTSKLFYGVYDLLKKGYFLKKTSILIYHSGGYRV